MAGVDLPSFVPEIEDDFYWDNACFSVSKGCLSYWSIEHLNLFHQVEQRLFRVPRYHLVAGSEHFAQRYSLLSQPTLGNEAMDPKNAVVLEGVTAAEFRTFLKICFPMYVSLPSSTSQATY